MARKRKPINTTNYPDHVIEKVARCLLPDILTYFESEEGQKEFEEWKKMSRKMRFETSDLIASRKKLRDS